MNHFKMSLFVSTFVVAASSVAYVGTHEPPARLHALAERLLTPVASSYVAEASFFSRGGVETSHGMTSHPSNFSTLQAFSVPVVVEERHRGELGEQTHRTAGRFISYMVAEGDTLFEISKRYDVEMSELAALNSIANVDFIETNQMLILPDALPKTRLPNNYKLTEEELDLLRRLVHAEARGESYYGKIAVAAVVLNRLNSPDYPKTITEVIYQPRQFSPVSDGSLYTVVPDKDTKSAVDVALGGFDPTDGSLFFYNPITSDPAMGAWHLTRTPSVVIGRHHFSR